MQLLVYLLSEIRALSISSIFFDAGVLVLEVQALGSVDHQAMSSPIDE